jgi:hypothetical protein
MWLQTETPFSLEVWLFTLVDSHQHFGEPYYNFMKGGNNAFNICHLQQKALHLKTSKPLQKFLSLAQYFLSKSVF